MYRVIKRCFDFTGALVGIIGTSPIWLFSIIMTELSDPGPLFYFAKRVGKDRWHGDKMARGQVSDISIA